MARQHTEAALSTLVSALKDPRHKVAAAVAILDRGWGRPKQQIETTDPNSPVLLHLLAAQAVSNELIAALERRTINGHAEPANGQTEPVPADLLSAPPPLE